MGGGGLDVAGGELLLVMEVGQQFWGWSAIMYWQPPM
jgi:hypothetical protein